MQVQVNKMLQDNMLILETALSAVSSAEKLVFGVCEGKKYSGYDDNDTASWRSKKELKCELMTKIQCLNGMISLYKKRYPGQILQFPDDLSKQEILDDLNDLKNEAKNNAEISKYAKYIIDLYNLLSSFQFQKYSVDEILEGTESVKPIGQRSEEDVFKLAGKFVKISDKVEKKQEDFNDSTLKNYGKFSYKFKKDDKIKTTERNDYFKNFYNNIK